MTGERVAKKSSVKISTQRSVVWVLAVLTAVFAVVVCIAWWTRGNSRRDASSLDARELELMVEKAQEMILSSQGTLLGKVKDHGLRGNLEAAIKLSGAPGISRNQINQVIKDLDNKLESGELEQGVRAHFESEEFKQFLRNALRGASADPSGMDLDSIMKQQSGVKIEKKVTITKIESI